MSERDCPRSALELMRSRFDAFKRRDSRWLMDTWHPSTRPESVDLTDNPHWKGLQIVDVVDGEAGQSSGIVEFRATYRGEGGIEVLHERSRFKHEDGRWYYVDGQMLN